MKWVAGILMIMNVLLFLRIGDHQVSAEQSQLKPDVNRESMLLLKEVSPVLESNDKVEVVAKSGGNIKSSADWSCYRVGPFKQQSVWDNAKQWAGVVGLEFDSVRSESRELRAVRVYLGPFDSIAKAQPEVAILKQKQLDYFVYLQADNQARISLGYFTQQQLANKFVAYLSSQNIDVKSQPEYRTIGPFDWMNVKINSAISNRLLVHDWGSAEVAVATTSCADA